MTHPMILQLRFTRSEFIRGLRGISEEDAQKHLLPMNCISWNVGHLTWHEQRYFLTFAQGIELYPEITRRFAYGAPASTPPLAEMLAAWEAVTAAADPWLDALTTPKLREVLIKNRITGNMLQRVIYHYWYHNGENQAIRQQLGNTGLEEFVGNIDEEASYQPE